MVISKCEAWYWSKGLTGEIGGRISSENLIQRDSSMLANMSIEKNRDE
jgi:hypothetical protein